MPSASKLEKKEEYHRRVCELLSTHDRAFLVHADNVGSKQFADIRAGLRPDSVILMGKNTMMKRSIKLYCEEKEDDTWMPLYEKLVGNVGIVFTKADLSGVKDEIARYKVGAAARVGAVAPNDVTIPAGPTSLDPSNTSFFQALAIATKITKGSIEIVADVNLIKAGDKVGASQAALLGKLGVRPFKYGLEILQVFEGGALFDPKVLDLTDDVLLERAAAAIANVAALSLAAQYPTLASVPHSVIDGYKNVLAIALATEYSFPLADKVKEVLKNPGAFVAAAAAAAPAAGDGGKAEAKKEEPEEEEEEDMGFSLFD